MGLVFLNGKIMKKELALVSASCVGFTLGASVFEACRVNWNSEKSAYCIFRIKDHIDRLFQSLKIMRMNLKYSREEILNIILLLIKEWNEKRNGYLRITAYISSESPGSSVYHPKDVDVDLCIMLNDSEWSTDIFSGINCCISSWRRIDDNSIPPRVKSACNYENTRLAGHEAILNGYKNAIILNQFGKVSEAAESAIFMVDRENILNTPGKDCDILESITRDTIIQLWKKRGNVVVERNIDRTELYTAKEIFLANTAKLIRPVIDIDRYAIGTGQIGEITQIIQNDYFEAITGKNERFYESSIIIKV